MHSNVKLDEKPSKVVEFQKIAEKYLPGGVAGSGRYNPTLGYSLYLKSAEGPIIYDLDGKEYIDYRRHWSSSWI